MIEGLLYVSGWTMCCLIDPMDPRHSLLLYRLFPRSLSSRLRAVALLHASLKAGSGNPGPLDRRLDEIPSTSLGGCRMKRFFILFMVLVLLVFLLPGGSLAKEGDSNQGRALYLKHCKVCHGPEGKGDGYTHFNPPVADLTVSRIQKKSDKELWESIHMGVPDTAMGMWRFVLSDEEIALVLGYVRSLAR